MYKVAFKYADGKKGVCRSGGEILRFNNEQEAAEYAAELNNCISDDMKWFFPVWYVEKE